ncbi:hypothetical protein E3E12_04650 [Formicincola oecophyllae]|uniref:Stringent starvation protein B n=1 Tax=Formicincola oecophyllae TaxID=2558361 RepID=A0A4Y6U9B1_9PROT|nr:ClpXP protease specificity-enhancing factor SspB [Formicincola oecophyllae]QDH13600.1 hypothetical protein E3E12_04650 [Formicincola oecophyllae]
MSDDPNQPDNPAGDMPQQPESLLPYESWLAEAYRGVMIKALEHVQREGLPGEHHFYLTFRTQAPGCTVPPFLKARYPDDVTIVLQHQFSNLNVDPFKKTVSVQLTFGGAPATLTIPFSAITQFSDPAIGLVLQFPQPTAAEPSSSNTTEAEIKTADFNRAEKQPGQTPITPADTTPEQPGPAAAEVVSLDAFRRKPDSSQS